jgi:hypothetical protein
MKPAMKAGTSHEPWHRPTGGGTQSEECGSRHTTMRPRRQAGRRQIAQGIEFDAGNGQRLREDRRWWLTVTDRVSAGPALYRGRKALVWIRAAKRAPSMFLNSTTCVKDSRPQTSLMLPSLHASGIWIRRRSLVDDPHAVFD